MAKKLIAATCVVIVALAMIAGVGYGIWRLMLLVPPNAARAWALAATVLLPVVAWGGHRLGNLEARGKIQGLDLGIKAVVGAANKVADVKVSTARAMRRPEPAGPPLVTLPEAEIVPRRQLVDRGHQVVEL